ncbi:hypothetical protein NPIL_176621, partial [Nephila pilipes]
LLSMTCSDPLSKLGTGHIKSLMFNGNEKTYAVGRCPANASVSLILDCIGAFGGAIVERQGGGSF